MNHIVIIGFMGSGKTRVGKRLAKDLGLPFIDVDRLIVKKMNMSVKEVFERFGEPFYRALETMAVKELSTDGERKVISVSAGLPLQTEPEISSEYGDDHLSEGICGNTDQTSGRKQQSNTGGS